MPDFAAQHTGGPQAHWTAGNIQARTMPLLAALIARHDAMIAPNPDAMVRALECAMA